MVERLKALRLTLLFVFFLAFLFELNGKAFCACKVYRLGEFYWFMAFAICICWFIGLVQV